MNLKLCNHIKVHMLLYHQGYEDYLYIYDNLFAKIASFLLIIFERSLYMYPEYAGR